MYRPQPKAKSYYQLRVYEAGHGVGWMCEVVEEPVDLDTEDPVTYAVCSGFTSAQDAFAWGLPELERIKQEQKAF